MPFPYADRDWTNVPTGTTPPGGAPVADDVWFEDVEDTLREHDAHVAANYVVHGGMVWYIAAAASPPTSPPTGLHWYKMDTEEEVINTGTSGSPVWSPRSEDAYKLTSADLVTDYVVSGLLAPVPSNSLTLAVPSGVAIITGKRISKSSASHAVPAGKHTFVDITNTGAFSNVDNGVLLEDCEDVWLEKTDADFTQSIIAGQVGNALRLAIAAGASAGDSVSEAIPSTDISSYGKIRMRVRSSVGTSAGDLQLLLDNTAQVASPVHTLNIPTLTANTWTTVELAYTPTTGSEAIISVGLKYAVDIGAVNVDIDDIWAVKATEPAVTANALRLMEVKADANIAQVSVVDITSAVNSTLYTVQIGGVDVTYTSDASATEGEIALGLVAAVNASTDPAVTPVTASTTAIAGDASATLTLTADVAGVAFTVAVGANLSVSTAVPNSTANVYEVIDRRTLNPTVRGAGGASAHNFWSSTHPDVDVADTPADGEVVTYDGTAGKWKSSALPSVGAASETAQGVAELATQTETDTGTDDARIVTPLKLHTSTATETRTGVAEIATQTETDTGTDDARMVTPAKLANYSGLGSTPDATETVKGKAELATQTETDTGTDDARIVTPLKLHTSTATETRTGVAEIATQAETDTGTDDARIVTPAKLANYSGLAGSSGGISWMNQSGAGSIFAAYGAGDPVLASHLFTSIGGPNVGPTQVGTTVVRLVKFRLPKALAISNVRVFADAATTNQFVFGIYRVSDGVKIWDSGTFSTSATTWANITSGSPPSLSANTNYWFALAAPGATASSTFRTFAIPSSTAIWGADAAPLGNLSLGLPTPVQVATTSGALPSPLPTLAAAAAGTAWMPFVFLEGTAS